MVKKLRPHRSWKHRMFYERFIKNNRQPVVKTFESVEEANICKRSLFQIKYRRNETFFISIRGHQVFIADDKKDFLYN